MDYLEGMPILTNSADSASAPSGFQPAWQAEMKRAIRSLPELAQRLGLDPGWAPEITAAEAFPVFVPEPYLARIEHGNPQDPLLRQVLPVAAEDDAAAGFVADPLNERGATLAPGILRKYRSRALLVVTGACAIHCRYCFRREFPYGEGPRGVEAWEPALELVAADPEINEVLLSGGDPLTLADTTLRRLGDRLDEIATLKRLRIHTRLPVVIPSRTTDQLVGWLAESRLQPWMVIHANHPRELDGPVLAGLRRLREAGVQLLNQSVLLRGINDDEATLIELSERLLDGGVLPYYLHQLDPVRGAAHFEVSMARGRELIAAMRAALPGLGVPRYVQERSGEPSKTVLA